MCLTHVVYFIGSKFKIAADPTYPEIVNYVKYAKRFVYVELHEIIRNM